MFSIVNGYEKCIEEEPKKAARIDVTHIIGTSRMNSSGHMFAPKQTQKVIV